MRSNELLMARFYQVIRSVPMPITKDDVVKVTRLARLELGDADLEAMLRDLVRIDQYVAELQTVDTTGVPPTTQMSVDAAPLRDDAAVAGLGAEQALSGAPRKSEHSFAVPAFVDD
jgi:aspartyl-tRNA(Asn)/glutamyl-tRNA(Gln) amidotransferase subunit C